LYCGNATAVVDNQLPVQQEAAQSAIVAKTPQKQQNTETPHAMSGLVGPKPSTPDRSQGYRGLTV
jgi:hypothetical protein